MSEWVSAWVGEWVSEESEWVSTCVAAVIIGFNNSFNFISKILLLNKLWIISSTDACTGVCRPLTGSAAADTALVLDANK